MTYMADLMQNRAKQFLVTLGLGLCLSSAPAMAAGLPLLTVSVDDALSRALSLQDLDALPQHEFVTTTQWTEGKVAFSGPSLKDVLGVVEAGDNPEETIHLIAANQYEIVLDQNLMDNEIPIVATRMNDKTFGLRDKGPLWVVFPYDADAAYQKESVYSASIWQLVKIEIERE